MSHNANRRINNSEYPDVQIFSETLAPALKFLKLQEWQLMCQARVSSGLNHHLKRGLTIVKGKRAKEDLIQIPPAHFSQLPYLGLFNLLYSVLIIVNNSLVNSINLLLPFVVLFGATRRI